MKTKTIEELNKFEDFEKFCNSHEECEGCELSEEQTENDKCEVEFWKSKFLLLKEAKSKRVISFEKYIEIQAILSTKFKDDFGDQAACHAFHEVNSILNMNNVSVSDV